MHLDSVFRFGIGWYFPSILPTNTKGILGQYLLEPYIWREPFFPFKRGCGPLHNLAKKEPNIMKLQPQHDPPHPKDSTKKQENQNKLCSCAPCLHSEVPALVGSTRQHKLAPVAKNKRKNKEPPAPSTQHQRTPSSFRR